MTTEQLIRRSIYFAYGCFMLALFSSCATKTNTRNENRHIEIAEYLSELVARGPGMSVREFRETFDIPSRFNRGESRRLYFMTGDVIWRVPNDDAKSIYALRLGEKLGPGPPPIVYITLYRVAPGDVTIWFESETDSDSLIISDAYANPRRISSADSSQQ